MEYKDSDNKEELAKALHERDILYAERIEYFNDCYHQSKLRCNIENPEYQYDYGGLANNASL